MAGDFLARRAHKPGWDHFIADTRSEGLQSFVPVSDCGLLMFLVDLDRRTFVLGKVFESYEKSRTPLVQVHKIRRKKKRNRSVTEDEKYLS